MTAEHGEVCGRHQSLTERKGRCILRAPFRHKRLRSHRIAGASVFVPLASRVAEPGSGLALCIRCRQCHRCLHRRSQGSWRTAAIPCRGRRPLQDTRRRFQACHDIVGHRVIARELVVGNQLAKRTPLRVLVGNHMVKSGFAPFCPEAFDGIPCPLGGPQAGQVARDELFDEFPIAAHPRIVRRDVDDGASAGRQVGGVLFAGGALGVGDQGKQREDVGSFCAG